MPEAWKKSEFNNAQEVFEHYYDLIIQIGKEKSGTKYLMNQGFTILNPLDNTISTPWRKWSLMYAQLEWGWYLSGDPDATEISKCAKIWANMQDEDHKVRSNYGWQWQREGQLDKVIEKLKKNPLTRQAVISIYDGKEQWTYYKDTPCTLAINFYIEDGKLNMTVMMRSNDLVFGFGNDQYCFSKLQQLVATSVGVPVGTYYHFATDLHIYERHYNMKNKTA